MKTIGTLVALHLLTLTTPGFAARIGRVDPAVPEEGARRRQTRA
jgi:hypothetical protein